VYPIIETKQDGAAHSCNHSFVYFPKRFLDGDNMSDRIETLDVKSARAQDDPMRDRGAHGFPAPPLPMKTFPIPSPQRVSFSLLNIIRVHDVMMRTSSVAPGLQWCDPRPVTVQAAL
jgi:hypothetical protein